MHTNRTYPLSNANNNSMRLIIGILMGHCKVSLLMSQWEQVLLDMMGTWKFCCSNYKIISVSSHTLRRIYPKHLRGYKPLKLVIWRFSNWGLHLPHNGLSYLVIRHCMRLCGFHTIFLNFRDRSMSENILPHAKFELPSRNIIIIQ